MYSYNEIAALSSRSRTRENIIYLIAVGTSIARRTLHRSRRADFPHRALQQHSLPHKNSLLPAVILCLRFSYVITFTPARLDMGGWFCLTQQGLAPCKKRQASWRTTENFQNTLNETSSFTSLSNLHFNSARHA